MVTSNRAGAQYCKCTAGYFTVLRSQYANQGMSADSNAVLRPRPTQEHAAGRVWLMGTIQNVPDAFGQGERRIGLPERFVFTLSRI
jgi:hypothetical protein